MHCPPVDIGQLVFLRHRPLGRHKIQEAWGPTVYQIVDISGTTHTVEPVEGGPVKRVHRLELRPCPRPVPQPRTKARLQTRTQPVAKDMPESLGPDFVVVAEVFPSQIVQPPNLFHVAGRDRVDVSAASVSSDESDFEGS